MLQVYPFLFQQTLRAKDNELHELKTKYVRHRQILQANYEASEEEVKKLDEIYYDTVTKVLRVSNEILSTRDSGWY